MIIQQIKKIVGIINDNPPKPVTKEVDNLSNTKEVSMVEDVNKGMVQISNL